MFNNSNTLFSKCNNNNINLIPKNIQSINNFINDAYAQYIKDNSFIAFKSIYNILFLIYSTKNKSIIIYNIINNRKINEIKNAHNEYITNFRHYLDNINKRDLILSISLDDNNIKLWNINNFECLLNLLNVNKSGGLHSACFLNDNNQIYIITSHEAFDFFEPIKVFDLKGNKIKEINNSNEKTNFIDIYFDIKLSKNYIITGNKGYAKSYEYNENKVYHKYYDNDKESHSSIIINNKEELIESSFSGHIRIWNFHTGELLNKIKVNEKSLISICLWNNEYLFVGCEDKTIKLIELKKGLIINTLKGHKKDVICIKKISHPKYGECLITQGWESDGIKIWINKN